MKIALFGSTGATGKLVLEQALAQGHQVSALVRDPVTLQLKHPQLTVQKGSPLSATDVATCVSGTDVVIHCLGIGGKGSGAETTLISDSVKVVLQVMQAHGVKRIICMSNVGAGGSGTWFAKTLVIPLFLSWLRPIIKDKDRMETALRDSQAEWVSVRLPNIVAGAAKPLRISPDGRGLSLSITDASTAAFLLEQATATKVTTSTPNISN